MSLPYWRAIRRSEGRTMDGYEFDFQTWSVSVDQFEKRNGSWRIVKRLNIYEKDRVDPHVPGSVPQSYFDALDLSRYPAAIRYHRYRNERASGRVPNNLILKDAPRNGRRGRKRLLGSKRDLRTEKWRRQSLVLLAPQSRLRNPESCLFGLRNAPNECDA